MSVAVHANRLAAAALLAAVLLVVGPSHAALTFNIVGVSGVESTFAGTATTYQSADTLQTLRLAGKLTITGPQGAGWNPGNGPIQANFCDASSNTNPGQTWPLKDHTTHTLDFTFNDPAAPAGYSLQNLAVFVHDHDVSRSTYDFDIFYSTVGDPATFIKIATACNWTYGNPGNPPGQQVSLDLTQANLTSVKTVRFVFRPMYWEMSSWIDEIDLNAANGALSPATILDLAAASATVSSVTLTWTAPGGSGSVGTASSYDVRYSTSPITEINWDNATPADAEPAPQVAGTTQGMTISGLDADTAYYFAIKATNDAGGVSFISNLATARTLDATSPSAISDLSVTDPAQASLRLTWTAPGDNGQAGTAANYDIRYSTTALDEGNWESATQITGEPLPAVAGTIQSMVVAGLDPDTMYYFAVKTSDEVPNVSMLSNIATGRTTNPDMTPPAAVTDLAVGNPTIGTLTLTWTAPGDDGSVGTASSYDIRYSTSEISDANWASATQVTGEPVPAVAGTVQSMVIRGLMAGTTYEFVVKTADEMQNISVLSNLASGTTAPPPSQVHKRVLSQADFRYKGYYRLPYTVIGDYPQGFTHRYVNGQLRFLTGSFTLKEYAAPANLGDTVTALTNSWSDFWTGTGLSPSGAWVGLWFEQARNRLWTTWAIDYPDDIQKYFTKSLAVRTLHDDGTISNVAGPWGLQGVQQRRLYGGVTALPQWFQDLYSVGPYACGWGGYASRLTAGGWASLGPTFYAFPEPTGYAAGDIPTSAFRTLMDHSAATASGDWYASGHPTSFDRGVRNTDVQNDYDAPQWQSPAPDGLGRWVWGDSAWNTGAWIDTPTRHGFLIVPKFCSGRVWYYGSTLNCERQTAEIQVFDPGMLGQVAQGIRTSWNTYPSSRWEITNDMLPLGMGWGRTGNSNAGGPAGATYDSTTRMLYVYCAGAYHADSCILVYDVGPMTGDVNADDYVNVGDLQTLVAAWGAQGSPLSTNWNADADLNGDGYINVGDLQILVANWGRSLN